MCLKNRHGEDVNEAEKSGKWVAKSNPFNQWVWGMLGVLKYINTSNIRCAEMLNLWWTFLHSSLEAWQSIRVKTLLHLFVARGRQEMVMAWIVDGLLTSRFNVIVRKEDLQLYSKALVLLLPTASSQCHSMACRSAQAVGVHVGRAASHAAIVDPAEKR